MTWNPKQTACAASFCLLALSFAPGIAQDCGDCNASGTVDILDALAAGQHGTGIIVLTGEAFRLCDVDGEKDVDVIDSLLVAQTSVSLPVSLACLPVPLPAPQELVEGRFATSLVCSTCHSNAPTAMAMRDELMQPIGPFDLWKATMMANAARDPFWRAQVSAEIASTPARATQIQQKCVRCHSPMASTEAALNGEQRPGLEILPMDTPRGQIARDGVSCTLCHQIQPDLLGTPASYSGNFVINDSREIYGPHSGPLSFSMEAYSTFIPVESAHILDSAVCGSCHTLFTATLDPNGDPTGDTMPEQMPYLEWRNSAFNDEVPMPAPQAASCQDCHMPITSAQGVPVMTEIARTPIGGDYGTPARSPYGRHIFVGGNTLMPAILRDNAADLGTLASAAEFDAVIALARQQLTTNTATIAIGVVNRVVDRLQIPVTVQNLTGHKFPTGYPSRRAWIRLEVRDSGGVTVFRSGAHDSVGQLLDGSGAPHPVDQAGGPIEPHHETIDSADQVQVYEAIMEDTGGTTTFLLMRAARNQKDNRLLPAGWSPTYVDIAAVAPAGIGADADYASAAGEDSLTYDVLAPAAGAPYTVGATLFYETISVRTAKELFRIRTGEIAAFRNYYQAADRTPETIATSSLVVP